MAILLALALTACGNGSDATPEQTPPPATPITVEVATAEIESVPSITRASGTVEPLRRVSPGTKLLGRIERVTVREGDRVVRGQLLAKLESRDLEAAVSQAEAALAMAEAQLDNSRAHHARITDLHSRGSVTDKNLEDATTGFHVAEAAVGQARANLAAARVQLGYAEITSPLSGWVTDKKIEAGDMIRPGAPLLTLEDVSRVKIAVNVPESEVVGLAAGGAARIEILDRRLGAVIDRVVPAGDPASRTFSVELVLDNPDGTFKSGMFARVGFEHGESQALLIPGSAIVRRGQLEGLFTLAPGSPSRARLRWIKTGRARDGRIEVLSGLEPGERYLSAPPPGLVDGAPVEAGS